MKILNTLIALTAISFVTGEATISRSVINEYSKAGVTSVLIQLKPASLPNFSSNSRSIVAEDFDNHADNLYNTLVKHSESTKGSVVNLLNEAKKSGLIQGYRHYPISNTFAVEAPKELLEKISKLSEVEDITSNKRFKSPTQDNRQIGAGGAAGDVKWDGSQVHWSLKYINATNIPRHVREAASHLRYANADSGVDFKHPALAKNYLGNKNGKITHDYYWWDANKVANATNPNELCSIDSQEPCDDHMHGTHCMGSAVGGMNLGVSPTTKWMACKNMDQNFGSPETYLGCLQFLLAPTNLYGIKPNPRLRPHVVGNSYYCPGEEGCARSTFKYAMRAMKSAGIFMSVCAGNDGAKGCSSIFSPPANEPTSFTVAASKYLSNDRASFSSMGPTPERPEFAIDVTAPGVNITSTIPGGKFGVMQGTSMATPHVAGAALLIIAACPHLNRRVDLIAKVIRESATPNYSKLGCGGDLTTSLPNNEYGFGILNVAKALKLCKETWY